jgi:hypothetical protein
MSKLHGRMSVLDRIDRLPPCWGLTAFQSGALIRLHSDRLLFVLLKRTSVNGQFVDFSYCMYYGLYMNMVEYRCRKAIAFFQTHAALVLPGPQVRLQCGCRPGIAQASIYSALQFAPPSSARGTRKRVHVLAIQWQYTHLLNWVTVTGPESVGLI